MAVFTGSLWLFSLAVDGNSHWHLIAIGRSFRRLIPKELERCVGIIFHIPYGGFEVDRGVA
jgi:hypothetical protein